MFGFRRKTPNATKLAEIESEVLRYDVEEAFKMAEVLRQSGIPDARVTFKREECLAGFNENPITRQQEWQHKDMLLINLRAKPFSDLSFVFHPRKNPRAFLINHMKDDTQIRCYGSTATEAILHQLCSDILRKLEKNQAQNPKADPQQFIMQEGDPQKFIATLLRQQKKRPYGRSRGFEHVKINIIEQTDLPPKLTWVQRLKARFSDTDEVRALPAPPKTEIPAYVSTLPDTFRQATRHLESAEIKPLRAEALAQITKGCDYIKTAIEDISTTEDNLERIAKRTSLSSFNRDMQAIERAMTDIDFTQPEASTQFMGHVNTIISAHFQKQASDINEIRHIGQEVALSDLKRRAARLAIPSAYITYE